MINFRNFLKLTYRRTTLTGVEICEIFAEKVQSGDSIISNNETTAGLQRIEQRIWKTITHYGLTKIQEYPSQLVTTSAKFLARGLCIRHNAE